MIRNAQDLADELAAEHGYREMLAHPETVLDALDLLGDPPRPLRIPCDGWNCPR